MSSLDRFEETAGNPDVRLAGLKIWIHGLEFPDATNSDDADWLVVTLRCSAPGASVWCRGPYLRCGELRHLRDGAARMHAELAGSVSLVCLEAYLELSMEFRGQRGEIVLRVDLTPDHLSQRHRFEFEIDQSYLGEFVHSCDTVLKAYPRANAI